ncbi:MAG: proteinase inhibitor serpin [Paenibacillus sp.]|nr:proteinase inhibitor serpin [Paenibacillus sp.]
MIMQVPGIRSAVTRSVSIIGLAGLLLAAGCQPAQPKSGGSSNDAGKGAYTPTSTDTQLVQGYNEFGFDLFKNMAATEPTGNLFMSPSSVAIALSMTMNGAAGTTRDGIAKALHLNQLSPSDINTGAQKMQEGLHNTDPKVQLSIANSIWARKDVKLEPAFLQTNKDYYKAQVSVLDFADSKAADTINKWVDKETKGKIDKIVSSPIDKDTVMFLLNAVYFKGDWTIPFEKIATSARPFTLKDGSKQNRSMMSRQGSFQYTDREGYNAVRLPYGNGNLGMVVLLPDEGKKLADLNDKLTGDEWKKLLGSLKEQEGHVILPRFKLEYETSLNASLQSLGMSLAFEDAKADFSALLAPPARAYISDVKHKTFVQVDEQGTEAAAVTSVEVRTTSAQSPKGFQMDVNRPFTFVIHEQQTGAVLFIGSISDPKLE